MCACIFCHIVILIKTLTALYPLLNRFQVCPLLLKSYVKQNSCSYFFMYAQGGDFLPGASQQCRVAGWALTEALGWALMLHLCFSGEEWQRQVTVTVSLWQHRASPQHQDLLLAVSATKRGFVEEFIEI